MKTLKNAVARMKQARLIRQALGLSIKDLFLWRFAEGRWLIAVILLFAAPFSLLCLYWGITEWVWQAFAAAMLPLLPLFFASFFWNELIHVPILVKTKWGAETKKKACHYESLKAYLADDALFETAEEVFHEIENNLPRITDSVRGAQRRGDSKFEAQKRNEFYGLYYSLLYSKTAWLRPRDQYWI